MGFILFFNSVLIAFLMFKVFLIKEPDSELKVDLEDVYLKLESLQKEIGALSADQYRLETLFAEFTHDAVDFADKNRKDILKRLENSRQYILKLEKELKGKK
jgi:hypothetical protein